MLNLWSCLAVNLLLVRVCAEQLLATEQALGNPPFQAGVGMAGSSLAPLQRSSGDIKNRAVGFFEI